jgi:hypothetical protein
MPKPMWVSARDVARAGVDGLDAGRAKDKIDQIDLEAPRNSVFVGPTHRASIDAVDKGKGGGMRRRRLSP